MNAKKKLSTILHLYSELLFQKTDLKYTLNTI